MTYNATLLESIAEGAGLIPLHPLEGVGVRHLYVTSEVNQQLDKPTDGFPQSLADRRIGAYLLGHCTWVCLTVEADPVCDVDFKRLVDCDEVWNLRFAQRDQKYNGWRMFGRFLGPSFFIGLSLVPRDSLATDAAWETQIALTIMQWNKLFPTRPPFVGTEASHYVKGVIRDVTQTDE